MPSCPGRVPARPSTLRRMLFQPDFVADYSSRDRTLSLMEAGGETSWRAGEEERNSCHHQPFRVRVSRPSAGVPLSCEVDLWDGKLVIGKLCERSPLYAAGARAGDAIAAANDCACETIEVSPNPNPTLTPTLTLTPTPTPTPTLTLTLTSVIRRSKRASAAAWTSAS